MPLTSIDTDSHKGANVVKHTTTHLRHQPRAATMAANNKRPRGKAPFPGAKQCSHPDHGSFGHSTQQCKWRKNRTIEDSPEDTGARRIRCFGRGKTGHRMYNCPEYGDKIKRKRGRKPVEHCFCVEDHFGSECPKGKEPDFDINMNGINTKRRTRRLGTQAGL